MRKSFLLLFSIVTSLSAWSQTGRRVVQPLALSANNQQAEIQRLPFAGAGPFFTYFVEWPTGTLNARIRFSVDGVAWTAWQSMDQDDHGIAHGSSLLYVGNSVHQFYQIEVEGVSVAEANLHFFHPGFTPLLNEPIEQGEARDLVGCPCPQPAFQNRSLWCPNGDCPIRGAPVATSVTHLVVHHTAGPNELSDWAAYMRSVWDFHVNGRGWDDIGYNWLIDPNGVIYQGRGDNVRGAHFCGSNTGTMGVAMMGDFTAREPTEVSLQALQSLLAWKSCDRDLSPLASAFHPSSGLNLKHIVGHRDGCSTSCPGDNFYPMFDDIREGVADFIEDNCALAGTFVLRSTMVNDSSFQLNWQYTGDADLTEIYLEKATGEEPAAFDLYQTFASSVRDFTEEDLDFDGIFRYRLRGLTVIGDTTAYSNILLINTMIVGQRELSLPSTAIQISPNPITAQTQVELLTSEKGEVRIELFTTAGQRLGVWHDYKQSASWVQTYNWSELSSGVYWLSVQVGDKLGVKQLVKVE